MPASRAHAASAGSEPDQRAQRAARNVARARKHVGIPNPAVRVFGALLFGSYAARAAGRVAQATSSRGAVRLPRARVRFGKHACAVCVADCARNASTRSDAGSAPSAPGACRVTRCCSPPITATRCALRPATPLTCCRSRRGRRSSRWASAQAIRPRRRRDRQRGFLTAIAAATCDALGIEECSPEAGCSTTLSSAILGNSSAKNALPEHPRSRDRHRHRHPCGHASSPTAGDRVRHQSAGRHSERRDVLGLCARRRYTLERRYPRRWPSTSCRDRRTRFITELSVQQTTRNIWCASPCPCGSCITAPRSESWRVPRAVPAMADDRADVGGGAAEKLWW